MEYKVRDHCWFVGQEVCITRLCGSKEAMARILTGVHAGEIWRIKIDQLSIPIGTK